MKNSNIIKLVYKTNNDGTHYVTGHIRIPSFKTQIITKSTGSSKKHYHGASIVYYVDLSRKILKANKIYKLELEIGLIEPIELKINSKKELTIGDIVEIITKEYKKQKRLGNVKDYYELKNIIITEIIVKRNKIIPEMEAYAKYGNK